MADKTALKASIDTVIRAKVLANSISTDNVSDILDSIVDELRPYKVYTVLISQAGTAAPTVKSLENSIGAIVWARTGAGVYTGTLVGAFTADKTALLIKPLSVAGLTFVRTSADVVTLNTNGTDVLLTDHTLEIRVYY